MPHRRKDRNVAFTFRLTNEPLSSVKRFRAPSKLNVDAPKRQENFVTQKNILYSLSLSILKALECSPIFREILNKKVFGQIQNEVEDIFKLKFVGSNAKTPFLAYMFV